MVSSPIIGMPRAGPQTTILTLYHSETRLITNPFFPPGTNPDMSRPKNSNLFQSETGWDNMYKPDPIWRGAREKSHRGVTIFVTCGEPSGLSFGRKSGGRGRRSRQWMGTVLRWHMGSADVYTSAAASAASSMAAAADQASDRRCGQGDMGWTWCSRNMGDEEPYTGSEGRCPGNALDAHLHMEMRPTKVGLISFLLAPSQST